MTQRRKDKKKQRQMISFNYRCHVIEYNLSLMVKVWTLLYTSENTCALASMYHIFIVLIFFIL